jgi:hypothetical protein
MSPSSDSLDDFEVSQGKSIGELWIEAAWFTVHSILAVAIMLTAIGAFTLTHPSAEDPLPKLIGTALAFFVPLVFGFLIARQQQNDVARHVWIAGLLTFAVVCVWVLDLPTGNGLCEHCLAIEKLRRTFFDISNGSGLIGGWGLMIGTWFPLSLFGYALGAKFALD